MEAVIDLEIKGDYNTPTGAIKEFIPNMVDDSIPRSQEIIYISPSFNFSSMKIPKEVKDITDYKREMLTNYSIFNKLYRYNTDPRQGYKRETFSIENVNKFIKANAKYIVNLWLKTNSTINIDGREYTIISKKIIEPDPEFNQQRRGPIIIKVEIRVLDKQNDTYLNRQKTACQPRRDDIDEVYEELFGISFFRKDLTNSGNPEAPALPRGGSALKKTKKKSRAKKRVSFKL